MSLRLLNLIADLRASYWLLPSLMASGAFLLSRLTLAIDEALEFNSVAALPLIYIHQPEGARALLSTVAGSMIGVAGVAFSILMVVLPMASSQFGPRLLRNFMRDRGSQFVLGTFVATFLYCLLILRTVRGDSGVFEADAFVPQLSVTVALIITVFNLGVFIYFIHHTAESIQMSHVLADVGHSLSAQLRATYPAALPWPPDADPPASIVNEAPFVPLDFRARQLPLRALEGGYLRTLNEKALLHAAAAHGAVLELLHLPGDYVMRDEPLIHVYPGIALSKLEPEVRRAVTFGLSRTEPQDPRFAFDQLLEVALRGLSPGVNDPYTALMCVDRIADNLALFSNRERPSPYRFHQGELRLIVPRLEPVTELHRLFAPLRNYGSADSMTMLHLLTVLARMARVTTDAAFRDGLVEEADRVRASAETGLTAGDYQRLAERYYEVRQELRR